MPRRSYDIVLTVNGCNIVEVIIDPHYELNHPDITDSLILELVRKLDGKEFKAEEREGEWEFFTLDHIEHQGKRYRLVWCMRVQFLFIGVINAFRR